MSDKQEAAGVGVVGFTDAPARVAAGLPPESSPGDPGEADLRALADNLPTLCWIANADGYITWYNKRWHDYCGTTPAAMEGWGWQRVHDPDILPEVMKRWTGSVATGEPFEMVFPLRGADGVFRPFLTRAQPVRDGAGKIVRWYGTNTDVSPQVQAETALLRERDRAQRVLNSMGEGYALHDHELRLLDMNAEALRMDPRPREQIIGRPFREAYPDAEHIARLYEQALAEQVPVSLEHRYVFADGRPTWLELRAYPVSDGIAAFYRDVTARREAQEALKASNAEHAVFRAEQDAILGQLEEGVIVTDREGRITFVNDAAARLHGVKELQVAPEEYTETYHLLTPDGRPHPVEDLPLARAVQRGETVTDARWRIRRPDGTEVLAIGTAKPLLVEGEVVGAVLTLRDDTARTGHELELRATEERFRLALKATNDPVWDWSFANGRVLWNEALTDALGHAPAGLVTSADWWLEQIHPDDRARVGDSIHAVIDGDGVAWSDEYRFARAGGGYADVLDRGTVIRDADGRAVRMIGAMLDLSERKRAEAALREGERRYRTLFEAIEVGFCVIEVKFDADGRPIDYLFVEANPAFARLLGLPDAPGRWMREIAPDHEQYWFDIYGRVATTGEPIQFEQWTEAFGRWLDLQAFRVDGPEPNRVAVLFNDVTERKRSEQALRDSEERLRLATDAAEVGLWDVDLVADRLIWPPRVKAMFGISPDAPVAMDDFYAGLHPDDAPATAEAFAAAADPQRRALYDVEYRAIGKEDGIERWVAAKGRGLFDENGRCIRVVGTALDITERKRTAEALREKDATIRAFYETSNLYTAVLELAPDDYCFVAANRETARFYGVEDLAGRKGSEFMPADLLPRMLGALRSAHDKGEAVTLEYPFKIGRQTHWYLSTLAPMPPAPSGKVRISVASFDITDRKRAERALKASEERLEAITDSVDQMIWSTRPDGYHDYYNRRWYEFTGMPPGSTDGEEWNGMFHPDDQDRAWERWRRSLESGEPYEIEYRLRHRSGDYRWVIGRARAVRDDAGRIARWYGTCTDVHDLKIAENALVELNATLEARIAEAIAEREQAEAQLRQAQKMEAVGQLTGGIAHDFNNLLTVVMGNVDMGRRALAAGPDGVPRVKRALDNAQRGAERAAALTQRLLAFARRQPLLPKPLDVDRLVAGMSDLLTRSLGETVQLEVVTAPGLWRVETDPNQLESAILNLAVNARDAMPGGGKLSIETANANLEDSYSAAHAEVAPGQYVVIAVSDTGEGMSRETLDHVFEPFFTTKEVGKGTGLGLSQVYGFVKQSGGHVKMYSELGAGTTVKIYLPRMLAGGVIEDESDELDPERAHAREAILVVEDDADVRRYSSEVIRELGYRVLEAEDGAAALRILERETVAVDLLFTDVVMPGLSGRELADAARGLRPGLRVLFTSGYTRNAIAQNGRLETGTAMIAKPFSFPALARKIRDVLDTGKSGRVLTVSASMRPGSARALENAGYMVDNAATASEALHMVRSGPGMFDAVIVDKGLPAGPKARLYDQLRALRSDLPILLVGDGLGAATLDALGRDACGAVAPGAMADDELVDVLSQLGVHCAQAHALANGSASG